MLKINLQSLRLIITMTLLLGLLYPLLITVTGKILFSEKVKGSLLSQKGALVGSELLSQKTEKPEYFWPRPSAGDYATVASGASNFGPTNPALKEAVEQRRAKIVKSFLDAGISLDPLQVPADLLLASGSGLDPHISPEAARFQKARIAKVRSLSASQMTELDAMIEAQTEWPQWGVFGEPRVNVLMLNLALDSKLKQ